MKRERNHRRRNHRSKRDDHGQNYGISMALWDGPMTVEEISEYYQVCVRRLGIFKLDVLRRIPFWEDIDMDSHMDEGYEHGLNELLQMGWVEQQEDGRFALTTLGRENAEVPIRELKKSRELLSARLRPLQKMLNPQAVSKVSLAAHLGLAAIKLPAGLISGSVGLINDGADTLLDGFASLLVYFGLRFDKERLVNIVLVFLMLITGSLALFNAIQRFFLPFEPQVDWFTFAAAIFSALVCSLLWLYQRYVGAEQCSVALITQSIDSRNHVIVAVSVTVGLIAALLNFGLLDALVGLVVALLILKSAVELAIEIIKSLNGEEVDFTHYKFGVVKRFENFRQDQFCEWMLYLVDEAGSLPHAELATRARQALDFSDNTVLSAIGLNQNLGEQGLVEQALAQLFERGWLAGEETVTLTPDGRKQLQQRMRM